MKRQLICLYFYATELSAFVLPALPPFLVQRLCILAMYFVAHAIGLQKTYTTTKRRMIANGT